MRNLVLKMRTFSVHLLSISVFFSGGAVVYTKHLSRELFIQLQHLNKEVENLQVEWGQLLLEQGTWASDARVDHLAQQRLHMALPEPSDVSVIRPKGRLVKE